MSIKINIQFTYLKIKFFVLNLKYSSYSVKNEYLIPVFKNMYIHIYTYTYKKELKILRVNQFTHMYELKI